MKYYPNPELKKFGEDLMSAMYDADIRRSMSGLGGCKEFNIDDFAPEFRPYILEYIKGNSDSVAICYAAMRQFEENLNVE